MHVLEEFRAEMCENVTLPFCIFLPLFAAFYIFITKKPQNVID